MPDGERRQRLARALVLDGDVREQRLQVVARLLGRLALLELGAVAGHHVPAGAAGRERVRRQDLDAVLRQVVPGLDPLRVALADHEDDDGVGDHALVLACVPVLRDDAGLDQARHVGLERERDDVGAQAGLDGAALLAGGPVGLLEGDALARTAAVEVDQLRVRLARGRVGDEADVAALGARRGRALRGRAAAARESEDGKGGCTGDLPCHGHLH